MMPVVAFGPVAHEARVRKAAEVDRNRDAARDHRLGACHKRRFGVERTMALIVEPRVSRREADLGQSRSGTDADRKRAGRDLGIERARIARLDGIEASCPVGDDPREDVDAPRRTLRVRRGPQVRRQVELLVERHHRDGAGLQNAANREIDLVRPLGLDPVHDAAALARQEAGTDAPCPLAEPKIKARRLENGRRIRRSRRTRDGARREQRLDLVSGEETRREARGFSHDIGSIGMGAMLVDLRGSEPNAKPLLCRPRRPHNPDRPGQSQCRE